MERAGVGLASRLSLPTSPPLLPPGLGSRLGAVAGGSLPLVSRDIFFEKAGPGVWRGAGALKDAPTSPAEWPRSEGYWSSASASGEPHSVETSHNFKEPLLHLELPECQSALR